MYLVGVVYVPGAVQEKLEPMEAPERLVSTMNQSNLAKNGLQCVSNRGIWSTSVTNTAFLLAFVTTPIDTAHSMHYACSPCAFCSCT